MGVEDDGFGADIVDVLRSDLPGMPSRYVGRIKDTLDVLDERRDDYAAMCPGCGEHWVYVEGDLCWECQGVG